MPDYFQKACISTELAHRLLAAAEQKAQEIGKSFTIAIVDESGVLKSFSRMDGAPVVGIQIAQDKAYTAAGFQFPTDVWNKIIKDDPALAAAAQTGIDRLVIFGGGYPIKVDDQVIGGVGVSGGHYTEDMEVAKAALSILE
ncbi:heme-binding protein [Paenibacillus validus]|uniref:Heme-binding protein n=1 Tax=Paenibacillus validus TaxID=44253 RepID=A0A7X2Z7Q0_9BACL|nr:MULTISPECIES: heme-binding protein [Paenibacillus]MED4601971.1 heme-binding protein [Paenibacillus validus]MED4608639.1 heme-binding protein [Paenibacillus validus]MUG69828.1 heme-binding protein [Paenibacillus validus]